MDSRCPRLGPAEMSGRWSVLHVHSRHEKKVAVQLTQWDIPFYLPLDEVERHRRKRWVPVFPSYVFLCDNNTEQRGLSRALDLDSVLTHIEVKDQKLLIQELQNLWRVLAVQTGLHVFDTLSIGRPARVRDGHQFHDMTGRIIRRAAGSRFVITLQLLGRMAEVEIDPEWLEAI